MLGRLASGVLALTFSLVAPLAAQSPRYQVRLQAQPPHRGSVSYRSQSVPWRRARAALVEAMRSYQGRFPIGSPRQISHLEADQDIRITEAEGRLDVTIDPDGPGTRVMFAVDLATRRVLDVLEATEAL